MEEELAFVRRETIDFAWAKKFELNDRTYVRCIRSFVDHSLLIAGVVVNTCSSCAIAYWVAKFLVLERILTTVTFISIPTAAHAILVD